MTRPKAVSTIGSFSLSFPPLAGVDFVQLDDGNLEFRLRVERHPEPRECDDRVRIGDRGQLDMILRFTEAHRRAHAP